MALPGWSSRPELVVVPRLVGAFVRLGRQERLRLFAAVGVVGP